MAILRPEGVAWYLRMLSAGRFSFGSFALLSLGSNKMLKVWTAEGAP